MARSKVLTVLATIGLWVGTLGCAPTEPSIFSGELVQTKATVNFVPEGSSAVIEVASPEATGAAIIRLQSGEWPKRVVVRLQLKTLEEFRAASAGVSIRGDLKSGGTTVASYACFQGDEAKPSTDMKIRRRGEWIEVVLPSRFVSGDMGSFSFYWKEK